MKSELGTHESTDEHQPRQTWFTSHTVLTRHDGSTTCAVLSTNPRRRDKCRLPGTAVRYICRYRCMMPYFRQRRFQKSYYGVPKSQNSTAVLPASLNLIRMLGCADSEGVCPDRRVTKNIQYIEPSSPMNYRSNRQVSLWQAPRASSNLSCRTSVPDLPVRFSKKTSNQLAALIWVVLSFCDVNLWLDASGGWCPEVGS